MRLSVVIEGNSTPVIDNVEVSDHDVDNFLVPVLREARRRDVGVTVRQQNGEIRLKVKESLATREDVFEGLRSAGIPDSFLMNGSRW